MKLIVLATLVAGAFCADVVTLTESNFDSKLKNEDIALVGQCPALLSCPLACTFSHSPVDPDFRVLCALV